MTTLPDPIFYPTEILAMRVTPNFRLREFICPCCAGLRIDAALPVALQRLRDAVGQPVGITSAYRCPKHNSEVGGSPGSQHLLGRAADIHVVGMSSIELRNYALSIEAFRRGGIGIYDGFVHVDVRPRKARWDFRTQK